MRLFRGFMTNIKLNLTTKPILETANELTIQLDSTAAASVSFVRIDYRTYDLVHTLVPEQLQGQGLGHLFAERIFDYLIGQNKKLKLSCEFLQHFYAKNISKYKGHVIEDFDTDLHHGSE